MTRQNTFKPVNPDGIRGKALAALLEGRVTDGGVVTLDSFGSDLAPTLFPHPDLHSRQNIAYCSFYIKGRRFERVIRWGNGGARVVRLGGRDYVICNKGAVHSCP